LQVRGQQLWGGTVGGFSCFLPVSSVSFHVFPVFVLAGLRFLSSKMMKVKEIAKMASHSPFAKDLHGTPIVPDLVARVRLPGSMSARCTHSLIAACKPSFKMAHDLSVFFLANRLVSLQLGCLHEWLIFMHILRDLKGLLVTSCDNDIVT
jgi:hypothetical protein